MEFAEILKYAQKVPILVFGIGIRLNLSVLELLELFEKKKVCKSSNGGTFKKPQRIHNQLRIGRQITIPDTAKT